MQIWINQSDDGTWNLWDHEPHYVYAASGPMEISQELHERIRESEREYQVCQDILESLDYEWTYPRD